MHDKEALAEGWFFKLLFLIFDKKVKHSDSFNSIKDTPFGKLEDLSFLNAPFINFIVFDPTTLSLDIIGSLASSEIGSIFFLDSEPNLLNLQVSSNGSGQLLKSFPANFLKLLSSKF